MADLFGRLASNIQPPITGDLATILWSGTVIGSATNLSISASQPISYRRTLGNKYATIIPGQPQVSLNMSRLVLSVDATSLFSLAGWQACNPASITVSFASCSAGTDYSFRVDGAVVANFGLVTDAESTSVIDQVSITALQLSLA
jgi:hypothetical protein